MDNNKIYSLLKNQGYLTCIIDYKHIKDLEKEILTVSDKNIVNADIYQEYMSNFFFDNSELDFSPRSLIIISAPDPQYIVEFNIEGKLFSALIPPTYLFWKKFDEIAAEKIKKIIAPEGYHLSPIRVPEKLLVVRSGLGKYGRNNISYIKGWGSFHKPAAFVSDYPTSEDHWITPQIAEVCNTCRACIDNCPTQAISTNRFLIYAEKCLTFHNEKPSEIAFPDWINPSWHNCLIGCMKCQLCCPMNKNRLNLIRKGPTFNEEETNLILKRTPQENLPKELILKLEEYDLKEYIDAIPRNLKILFNQSKK